MAVIAWLHLFPIYLACLCIGALQTEFFFIRFRSIVSVWLAPMAMLSNSSIGVGDGPKSIYSTLSTVTFIWNSLGRGLDHITLYISEYPSVGLRVSQVTCGNVE